MMVRKYLILLVVFSLCCGSAVAASKFVIHDFSITLQSDIKKANENIINGLKNYFSRFEGADDNNIDDILSGSRRNVQKSLEVYGYFSPSIKISHRRVNNKIYVDYNVSKGQQVSVVGLDISIPSKVIDKVGLKKDLKRLYALNNNPYDGIELAKLNDNILDKIRSSGYPFAEFEEASMSFVNPLKIVLKLKLNLNQYYQFGDIIIKNSKALKTSFIKSYANFKPGDSYNTILLNQFQKDLVSSGFFDEVNVHPINWNTQNKRVPIYVNVVDTNPWTRNYTIGYDDKYHFGGSIGYKIKPYNSMGHSLEFFLRLATNDYIQLRTNYVVPSARPLERIYLFASQIVTQNLVAGEAESALLTAALQQRYKNWLIIPGFNMFVEHSMPNNESNYTTELIYPQINLLYKVKYPYQWLDRFSFGASFMVASEQMLSGISMDRVLLRSEGLVPISERLKLHLLANFGALSSSNISDVPLSLKFFAGGPDSIRGYSYNEFGPGRYEKNLSYELQYSLSSLLDTFVFMDQGNASDKWDDKLKSSVGVGMMLNFKVIGLKFSLAHGLDDDADPFKIQFTVQSMD